MMEVGSGNVKALQVNSCTLMLVVGEIRTRAGSSLGLGDAAGEAALKHSAAIQRLSEGAVMKKPAPGDTADVERIRKMPPVPSSLLDEIHQETLVSFLGGG